MVSQRVPNMTATSAEVGGTVDSHSRPITAPKISVATGLAGSVMKTTIASGAGEIDGREDVALGHAVAETARAAASR